MGAAVAALALLLGLHGSAQAQIRIDGAKSVSYAKETLIKTDTTTASDTDDETTYYDIVDALMVTGKAGVPARENHEYFVTYRLGNMVFANAVATDPDSPGEGDMGFSAMTPAILADDGSVETAAAAVTLDPEILDGGAVGDNVVIFELTIPATGIRSNVDLRLTGAMFAVSGEGSGSITRTVSNRTLGQVAGTVSSDVRSLAGAVKTSYALSEAIRLPASAPVAAARHDFMSFASSTTTTPIDHATVGTIILDVVGEGSGVPVVAEGDTATPEQTAMAMAAALKDGRLIDAQDGTLVTSLSDITALDTTDKVNNPVTFSGSFSFVDVVGLANGIAMSDPRHRDQYPIQCADVTEIREASEADPDVLTNDVTPQGAISDDDSFDGTGKMLCLQVDGETIIPVTEAYMVTTAYKGVTGAAFPPVGNSYALTGIEQDGTTVRIPFMVSQEDRYRQRVSITNRNADAVEYSFTFTGEEGATITAGTAAEGEVPGATTLVLDTRDVVTVEGGVGRTSATLSVVASSGTIDVGVMLVNRSDGSTTVVHAN
jgi:hypothetical protein